MLKFRETWPRRKTSEAMPPKSRRFANSAAGSLESRQARANSAARLPPNIGN
jgi:hypothetical protein